MRICNAISRSELASVSIFEEAASEAELRSGTEILIQLFSSKVDGDGGVLGAQVEEQQLLLLPLRALEVSEEQEEESSLVASAQKELSFSPFL